MTQELEQKMIDLEMRLSFQEDTIDQLNDVILFQNGKIEALERKLGLLSSKLESLEGQEESPDERPPHY